MKRTWTRSGCTVLAAATLALGLSGCLPLVVGGGMATTAMVASDRRTTGSQVEDQSIEMRAKTRIQELLGDDRVRVGVTSFNRRALIYGEARNEADKQAVEKAVREIPTVTEVFNEVEVTPFLSSITQASKDTFITSKVKASLINAKDIQASAIKVVTDRNVVYLLGIVTERESRRAAEIARGVNDVRKVVRIFETVSEDALANYTSQPAPVVYDAQPSTGGGATTP